MPMQTPDLVTATEAARILGVHHRAVLRMAAAGDLKVAYRAPGRRGAFFFRRATVERLAAKVAKREQQTAGAA